MNRTEISRVWLTEDAISLETIDGRVASELFENYPRLSRASKETRENYRLSHFGIHWVEIDEDLSFDGFFNKGDYISINH